MIFHGNDECLHWDGGRRGNCEEEILHPTDVAVAADRLVAVAEGVGGSEGALLVGRRAGEEGGGLGLEPASELEGNAVVDDLKEARVLAGLDDGGGGIGSGLREVHDGDATAAAGGELGRLHEGDLVEGGVG